MNRPQLGLILTYRCNALCGICCNNSGPHRTEDMNLEDALNFIDKAAAYGVKRIGLTGGEPFLFFKKIIKISEFCKSRHLFLSCLTNAYWAIDKQVTEEVLKTAKDKGLSQISISTSEYHQEFIPLDRIENCINAAIDNDMYIEFRVLIDGNSKKLKDYQEKLGLKESNKITLVEYPISRVGRAANLDIIASKNDTINSRCTSIFNTPVIEPNGDLYICCGVGYKNKHLFLGNLKEDRLSSLLENANNNILYSAISSLGPQSILKIVEEDGNKIKLDSSITDICHLCSNLLSNERNHKLVIESLRKRSVEILAASRLTNLDLQDEMGSMPTSALHHSSQL